MVEFAYVYSHVGREWLQLIVPRRICKAQTPAAAGLFRLGFTIVDEGDDVFGTQPPRAALWQGF